MDQILNAAPIADVKLLPSMFKDRSGVNRKYLVSLKNENLLQNHYMEAGMLWCWHKPEDCHWGWEAYNSTIRGHFLGHWLSAAAKSFRSTGDQELKGKADKIIEELALCQQQNGGEWVGPIPEKYLEWAREGRNVGVPHYNLHKTMMGLWDMYEYADNQQALGILEKWANWFSRWTSKLSLEEMDRLLEVETGGMLEIWANLYGLGQAQEYLTLMQRYDRRYLFDRLLQGEDALTNMHANTTIPEVLGAAKAYEVTGELRWKEIVLAYWNCAVTDRGYFCTGGQTSGEIWCPPGVQAARLGVMTQEHCSVYNMMRLAEFLLRWTGDPTYADYIERNLYNGILAQQHRVTGMPAYYLPLEPGAVKKWGSQTEDFWCCHGSVVQAQASYEQYVYYQKPTELVISQYIPSETTVTLCGSQVHVALCIDPQSGSSQNVVSLNSGTSIRPNSIKVRIQVGAKPAALFGVTVRLPWWVSEKPEILVNGAELDYAYTGAGFVTIQRTWGETDQIELLLPKKITACRLSDLPDMAAFMDGPVVLAGLCDGERILNGDIDAPEAMLRPIDERHWIHWLPDYLTVGQSQNLRFVPLYNVTDEQYTVYFPFQK